MQKWSGKKIRLFDARAQHLTEYAIVFSVVLISVIAMQAYIKRGLQGRYRDATDHVISSLRSATGDGSLDLQYEPYYTHSSIGSTINITKKKQVSIGGATTEEIQDWNKQTKPGSTQVVNPAPLPTN